MSKVRREVVVDYQFPHNGLHMRVVQVTRDDAPDVDYLYEETTDEDALGNPIWVMPKLTDEARRILTLLGLSVAGELRKPAVIAVREREEL